MKQNSTLNKIFDIADSECIVPDIIENNIPVAAVSHEIDVKPLSSEEITADVQYARKTLNSTIERAQQLLEIALERAADDGTCTDRTIEVTAGTIDKVVNAAGKLIELHTKMKEISGTPQADMGSGNTFINTNNINLTTDELIKKITGSN